MKIYNALVYVKEHGDLLDRARASTLTERLPPPEAALTYLEERQGDAGGWPIDMEPGNPHTVAATCEALFALQDLALTDHAMARRSWDFLLSRQEPDGAWEPQVPEGYLPPPWLSQGQEAGRLYLTALVSALMVVYGREKSTAGDQALDLLLNNQLEGGAFVGFPRRTTAYALPILATRLGQRSGPAQNIVRSLSLEMAEGVWYASTFASMLRNLLTAGFGMDTLLVRQAWEQLLIRQKQAGFWESEAGEADRVRTTLEVMWCWNQITFA